MMSQTEKQIITIHILPNISRRKGNQTIKVYQFIYSSVYKIQLEKKFLLKNHSQNVVGKLVPDPNLKNQN